MVTMVLLKVDLMCAMPRLTLRRAFFFLLLAIAQRLSAITDEIAICTGLFSFGFAPVLNAFRQSTHSGLVGCIGPISRTRPISLVRPIRGNIEAGQPSARLAHFLDALLAGNGLARTFARARVGAGTLAPDGQVALVPGAAVTLDFLQACDVLLFLAAQLSFDHVLAVKYVGDPGDLFFGQLFRLALRVNLGLFAHFQRRRGANAPNIAERNMGRFLVGQVNAQNTRHGKIPQP